MASKVLTFVRNIFSRERYGFSGEDGPRYKNTRYNNVQGQSSGYGALYSQGMSGGDGTTNTAQEDLLTRYADYEDMDEYPELSAALDIVADDATQTDHLTGKIVHIKAEDSKIQEMLEACFHTNIRIDEKAWEICRTMCKYGNDFEEHVITDSEGLIDINFLSPPQTRRIDDEDQSLLGYVYDKSGQFSISTEEFDERIRDRELNQQRYMDTGRQTNVLEDWEATHFRLRSKQRGAQYGWSFLESARWTVKRLSMLEDAAILYKISRAPQRFVFNVDVGDLPPNEALGYVNKVKQQLKKQKIINPQTGKLDLTSNAWANDEDFFIPTRKDKASMEVDTVGGFDSQFYIDDLEYFKDKLYAAIKIPKDYLNYSEDSVSKANLSQEDIRFARTIIRIQRELRTGFINMGRVHLAALNVDPDMVDFDIFMTPPSSIFEMAMMEVRQAQLDIAENYRAFVDDYWIMTNILKFSDDEIEEIKERLKKQNAEDDPFGENRFPTIESLKRKTGTEVKKILEDFGLEAMMKDPKIGKRLQELKKLGKDMKPLLSKK